jgi:hypothetical protein
MKKAVIVCCLVLNAVAANAVVEPETIHLHAGAGPWGTQTYTVPPGKHLLVRQVYTPSVNQGQTLMITNGAVSWAAFPAIPMNDYLTTFNPPLIVQAQFTLAVSVDLVHGDTTMIVFGLLVDTADLYASIDSEIISLAKLQSAAHLKASVASPRPAVVTLERSADLLSWMQPADASLEKETALIYQKTLPLDATTKEFFRVKARARN